MAIVYLCENTITKNKYVGVTIRSLLERKWEHFKELNSGSKGGIWQKDFDLFGKSSFEFSVLQEVEDVEILLSVENNYILKYNCLEPNGYNKKLNGTTTYSVRDYLANSKLSVTEIHNLLQDVLSIDPYFTTEELAVKYASTVDSIQDIIRCKSHRWFGTIFPEEYSLLEEQHLSGLERKSFLLKPRVLQALYSYLEKSTDTTDTEIANNTGLGVSSVRDLFRGKSFTWASTEFPEVYKLVRAKYQEKNKKPLISINDKLTGTRYTFTSLNEAQAHLSIDRRRISELISGKRKILQDRYEA